MNVGLLVCFGDHAIHTNNLQIDYQNYIKFKWLHFPKPVQEEDGNDDRDNQQAANQDGGHHLKLPLGDCPETKYNQNNLTIFK